MSERRDGDRIVVTGPSAGSHFPREQAQMEYNWEANGLGPEGPYDIQGSVYGKSIRFRGPGTVRGTVLGRGDISLEPGSGCQRFLSGVAAGGSIVSPEWAAPLRDTSVGDLTRSRVVIRGDLLAENIVLDGAVVFGNVEATRVRLSHSIVVGSIVAHERLEVRASSLFAYHAGVVSFEGPCSLIHAMGESRNLPVMTPYRDLDGTMHPPTIELYPLVRGRGSLFNRGGLGDSHAYAQLSLDHDWVLVRAEDGTERYALSIMGRALNVRSYGRAIDDVYHLLRTSLEFDHYSPRDQERTRQKWSEIATSEELWVLQQSTGAAAGVS